MKTKFQIMTKHLPALLLASVVAYAPQPSTANEDGAQLAWRYHCTTCHGDRGIAKSDRYPNLAGQNPAYIVSRLRYFRSGAQPGNQMNGQAAPLSDETIEKLASFFYQPNQARWR
jgi:cytochrome c553